MNIRGASEDRYGAESSASGSAKRKASAELPENMSGVLRFPKSVRKGLASFGPDEVFASDVPDLKTGKDEISTERLHKGEYVPDAFEFGGFEPANTAQVLCREFKRLIGDWDTNRLGTEPREACEAFVRKYEGESLVLKWPQGYEIKICSPSTEKGKELMSILAQIENPPEAEWMIFLGVLRNDYNDRDPSVTAWLFLTDAREAFAYDESVSRTLFKLCSNAFNLFDQGIRNVRSIYNVMYENHEAMELKMFGHRLGPNSPFAQILRSDPGSAGVIQYANMYGGSLLRNVYNDHSFVLGRACTVFRIPQEALDAMAREQLYVVGMTSFMDCKIVVVSLRYRGVFHLVSCNSVMLVAENMVSYLRMKDPKLLLGTKSVYTWKGSADQPPLGKVIRFDCNLDYKLPDTRYYVGKFDVQFARVPLDRK